MVKTAFSALLERCYIEWQAKSGGRRTIDEFAEFIGASQPLVSMWLNGTRMPSYKYKLRLVSLFGAEMAKVLNIDNGNDLDYVISNWGRISNKTKYKIRELIDGNIYRGSESDELSGTTDTSGMEAL